MRFGIHEMLSMLKGNRLHRKSVKPLVMGWLIYALISPVMLFAGNGAGLDWRVMKDIELAEPPLDIVTSFDGAYLYILTTGAVSAYSRSKDHVVKRMPVSKAFDRLSFIGARNELVLTSSRSKTVQIIKIYPLYQINTQGSPFFGKQDAPVSVVVFNDYMCSACALFEKNLENVLGMYPEEVKLVIKHYPASVHEVSKKAAAAARAAQRQGKFKQFHRLLFQQQTSLNVGTIIEIADRLNLDMDQFNQDRQSPQIMSLIDGDLREGRSLGINATPTIFINGKYLERLSMGDLIDMIEAEIKDPPSN